MGIGKRGERNPLALFKRRVSEMDDPSFQGPFHWRTQSGRGLPQSKTSRNFVQRFQFAATVFIETLQTPNQGIKLP